MKHLLLIGAALGAAAPATALTNHPGSAGGGPILLINEVRIDQGGTDNDEYFELLSIPSNLVLDGYFYVSIGDGAGGSGVIETVVDLTGTTTSPMGLFLCGESTMTIGTPDLVATLNFENGDNVTHFIVEGFTGAVDDDLDTNDDGVLDVTPWTAIVDGLDMVQSVGSGDQVYAASLGFNSIGPDGSFVPAHAFRCLTSLTDWRIGTFSTGDMIDTPGAFNNFCATATSAFCDPGEPNEFSPTGGTLSMSGSLRIGVNDNVLVASDIPDFFGVFVQSDSIGAPMPASIGGNICLNGPIQRMNTIVIASMNQAMLPLDFDDAANVESTTLAGSTMYYQMFHRDSTFPGGGNFTNGLAVTWGY